MADMFVLNPVRHSPAVYQCWQAVTQNNQQVQSRIIDVLELSSNHLGTVAVIENVYRAPLHTRYSMRRLGQTRVRFSISSPLAMRSGITLSLQMLHACPSQQNIRAPLGHIKLDAKRQTQFARLPTK